MLEHLADALAAERARDLHRTAAAHRLAVHARAARPAGAVPGSPARGPVVLTVAARSGLGRVRTRLAGLTAGLTPRTGTDPVCCTA